MAYDISSVDCIACLVNKEFPDEYVTESGPRVLGEPDENGVRHAFMRSEGVRTRGWWKCDFYRMPGGAWARQWHPDWDP